MRAIYSLLLGFPPVWLLSALLHRIDPDINDISDLADPTMLLSITIVGLFLYLPVLFPLAALHSDSIRGYWVALVGVSCAVGAALTISASGAAINMQERLVLFVVLTLVCIFVYLIATLPSVLARRYSCLRPR